MRQTGADISEKDKGTSLGGLALSAPNCWNLAASAPLIALRGGGRRFVPVDPARDDAPMSANTFEQDKAASPRSPTVNAPNC
ncbi:MAG: hypothetical protein Q4G36_10505 [Paracoccus sp. (in: a-proteobacteria)]|nr:hypothetical protein [Paracoccus sp. (in: a-proteobacteria)]